MVDDLLQMAEDAVTQVNDLLSMLQESKEVSLFRGTSKHLALTEGRPKTFSCKQLPLGLRAPGCQVRWSSEAFSREGAKVCPRSSQDPIGGRCRTTCQATGRAGQ